MRHTDTYITIPLDEESVRRRVLYPAEKKKKIHKRQTPMTPAGFEPAIAASERPQTNALGCGHTASVFGRYFTLTYTADNGRTNKCVYVSGDGLSGAVLHRRARTCFAN